MGYFILHKEIKRVLFKVDVLLGLKISDFGEKGVGFFRPKSAKRGCFSNLGTSMVYALVRVCVCVCVCVGGGGGGGGGAHTNSISPSSGTVMNRR